jgi:hypothetical protein
VKIYSNYGSLTDPSSIGTGNTVSGGSTIGGTNGSSTTSPSSRQITQNSDGTWFEGANESDDLDNLDFDFQLDQEYLNSEGVLPPLPQPSPNNSESIRSPLERQVTPQTTPSSPSPGIQPMPIQGPIA